MDDELDAFLDQFTKSWTCPTCGGEGREARVRLFQANSEQAIYFCETADCSYPQAEESEDGGAVVVSRSLFELPVTAATLAAYDLPQSLLTETDLTLRHVLGLSDIADAYRSFETSVRLEKELAKLKGRVEAEAQHNSALGSVTLSPRCTNLHRLRQIPEEIMKYVKHVVPNIENFVDLLNLDIL